jgi:hypothetical protein
MADELYHRLKARVCKVANCCLPDLKIGSEDGVLHFLFSFLTAVLHTSFVSEPIETI